MVCLLSAPRWQDPLSPGLQSAVENIADSTIVLSATSAVNTDGYSDIQYLIFYNTNPSDLYSAPKLFSNSPNIIIPSDLVPGGILNYFAVYASQGGVSSDTSASNIAAVNQLQDVFASPTTALRAPLGIGDTHIQVDSYSGFPDSDGYVSIGNEVIRYSSKVTFGGGDALLISNRQAYSCSVPAAHNIGDSLSIYFGGVAQGAVRLKPLQACGMPLPTWTDLDNIGVSALEDLGIGKNAIIKWGFAESPSGMGPIYYNIYQSKNISTLRSGTPLGLYVEPSSLSTTYDENQAIVTNVSPRDGYYYMVKATYFTQALNTTDMIQISENFFEFPNEITLQQNISSGFTGQVTTSSTEGYPSFGYVKVGSEVIAYSAKTQTSLTVSQRDVFDIGVASAHSTGDTISFFKGVEDTNQYFQRMNTSWDGYGDGYGLNMPLQSGDGYWGYEYRQNPDGYRDTPIDYINEDHEYLQNQADDLNQYDYCGVKNTNHTELYDQNFCGVYSGVFNGFGGGYNVQDIVNQRHELMLGMTGESFVLLKRKWEGVTCPRLSNRREHSRGRCTICYNTGFTGGFNQYINQRQLRQGEPNPNGFIQGRVSPYTDDVVLNQDRGFSNENIVLEVWTLSYPIVKDRDILVRYIFDKDTGYLQEEFRYEVLSVTRNKLFFGKDGRQVIRAKRLNKTHEIYKFPITLT